MYSYLTVHLLLLGFNLNLVHSYRLFGFGNGFRSLHKDELYNIEYLKETNETRWIEQPLDHFDSNETRRWKIRYFERLDFWKKGGPIFIFITLEGDVERYFLYQGVMSELAKETNGAMYIAEHRYYGTSIPFRELTTKKLKYLSSRQALADIAHLLETLKEKNPEYDQSKVVVIGRWLGGNLAAWMRLLYPDLIYAAIASSAPVLAKVDCYECIEKVSDDYKYYGTDDCMDNILKIFKRYEKLLETDSGIEKIMEEEQICDDVDMTKPENQQLFFYDKINFGFTFPAEHGDLNVIKEVCVSLKNTTHIPSSIVEELNFWDKEIGCYNYDYDTMMEFYKSVSAMKSWPYQYCTEYGHFPTTDSKKQPFGNNLPISLFYKFCTDLFGPEFDEARVKRGVKETNELYGGLHPNVTRVIFVNGDMDPWSTLGVLKDLSHDAPAKVIPRTSHSKDLLPNKEGDVEELKEARSYIKNIIKRWLQVDDWSFYE